jgi:hypothetical protein
MDYSQYEPEIIAHRSTRGEGRHTKRRWTELSVTFLHIVPPGGARWIAETVGKSEVAGERTITRRMASVSLDQALAWFDNSAPARVVGEIATLWLHDNAELVSRDLRGDTACEAADAFTGTTDAEALIYLYGADAVASRGFQARVARDFGLGESTVRMALKGAAGLRVPLTLAAAAMDRDAFHAAARARTEGEGVIDG